MCEECRQTYCPTGCPNVPEPPIVLRCSICGEPIYAGELYVEELDLCAACLDALSRQQILDLFGYGLVAAEAERSE